MNLSQVIEVLPPLVYIRRGELVVQFATTADLIGRVAELSSVLTQLDQESSRTADPRGRNRPLARTAGNGGTRGQLEPEAGDGTVGESKAGGSAGQSRASGVTL
jgi:hypothetical protein